MITTPSRSATLDQRAAVVGIVAAGCGLAGLAAVATGRASWSVVLTVAGVGLVVAAPATVRVSPVTVLAGLGIAASCWDAVRVGSTSLFDLLCAAGLVAALIGAVRQRDVPIRWPARTYGIAFGGFALAALLVAIFPPDPSYLASRIERPPSTVAYAVAAGGDATLTDVGGLARLAVGLLVLPLALAWYARTWARLLAVGRAYLAGAVLSSVVGLTDHLGVTAVQQFLVGYIDESNRTNGLTSQPNHLALTAVMALPFAWLTVRRWPLRAAIVLTLLAGVFVSGSRAGIVGALVALLGCLVWQYRARVLLLVLPVGMAALLASPVLLSFTRFGTENAAGSDAERGVLLEQGLRDFAQSPLFGIGLRVSQTAHVVYVQLLASAGLIGLLSFVLLLGTALLLAYRLRHQAVVLAAGLSLTAYVVVAVASNALLVRYLFVPLAIVFVAARQLSPPADAAIDSVTSPNRGRTGGAVLAGRAHGGRDDVSAFGGGAGVGRRPAPPRRQPTAPPES